MQDDRELDLASTNVEVLHVPLIEPPDLPAGKPSEASHRGGESRQFQFHHWPEMPRILASRCQDSTGTVGPVRSRRLRRIPGPQRASPRHSMPISPN